MPDFEPLTCQSYSELGVYLALRHLLRSLCTRAAAALMGACMVKNVWSEMHETSTIAHTSQKPSSAISASNIIHHFYFLFKQEAVTRRRITRLTLNLVLTSRQKEPLWLRALEICIVPGNRLVWTIKA